MPKQGEGSQECSLKGFEHSFRDASRETCSSSNMTAAESRLRNRETKDGTACSSTWVFFWGRISVLTSDVGEKKPGVKTPRRNNWQAGKNVRSIDSGCP